MQKGHFMKIEKLNENQLKITLAPEDLSIRGLALTELSYGSPKTKDLYNELLEQAISEFGFESEEGALVIEAIPTSKGNLIIFITKNPSTDDLDTRFSRFSPDFQNISDNSEDDFVPLTDMLKANGQSDSKTKSAENPRLASSLISSRVIGPVVSCEPTVRVAGSQYCPARTPRTLQALPTIF